MIAALRILAILAIFCTQVSAQTEPEIVTWKLNTTGATGYAGIISNVQQVQYSNDFVYVSASCIPDYNIGPWTNNPNIPVNKNFVFKFTRNPIQNTAQGTTVGLGHIGVWSNGVSIFNARDGMSYNNANVWHRDALFFEGISFDDCLGHPAPGGEYHHHVNPVCLYDVQATTVHSPIIGYAFDGFPVYGAHAYANTDGTGSITRMKSSYVKNTYTTRVNGPDVDATYPIGAFTEDYTYVAGSGDLDEHNGRFCITPEYPDGIYAYFVTVNEDLYPIYPYVLGATYYGVITPGNTGPNGGHNVPAEAVETYNPASSMDDLFLDLQFEYYPNPVRQSLHVFMAPSNHNNLTAQIFATNGQLVFEQANIQPAIPYQFDLSALANGNYYFVLSNDEGTIAKKIMVYHE